MQPQYKNGWNLLHFWSLFFWFVITFQCTCPNPHCTFSIMTWLPKIFFFKFLSFFLQNTNNKNLNKKEKTLHFLCIKNMYILYVHYMYTICILYVHLSSANSKLSLRQKDFQRNAAGHSDLCFKNRPKSQFCVKRYHRLPLVCFKKIIQTFCIKIYHKPNY